MTHSNFRCRVEQVEEQEQENSETEDNACAAEVANNFNRFADDSDEDVPETDQLKPEELFEKEIHRQTTELFRVRAGLRKDLSKDEMNLLLKTNGFKPIENTSRALTVCADIVAFGSPAKCQKCWKGELFYTRHGYSCNQVIDEWKKCGNVELKPLRVVCKIPPVLKGKTFFAKACELSVEDRLLRPIKTSSTHQAQTVPPTNQTAAENVVKVNLKRGNVVDYRSKLSRKAHIYKYNSVWFSSTLSLTDIDQNKNSYFKLQVLESDTEKRSFWLFTSWGRIGTNIGNSKTEPYDSAIAACKEFARIYEEKTGNNWKTRNVRKFPGKYYPVDVDYSSEVKMNKKTPSQLAPKLLDLMKLLFNVQSMTKAMNYLNLDLDKMPLGKLSKKQLTDASSTLNELEKAIKRQKGSSEINGLSEKFYTLIPHNFGENGILAVDSLAKIKEKREMVDSLSDIEVAYSIMVRDSNGNLNSFDHYYNQLNCEITPVDKKSRGYELIDQYVQNTSVGVTLQILGVFKINRNGEKDRYAKFKDVGNRMLLWHGSPVTNFVSIISNGLRNPSAQRGIYFADMVTKSVGYWGVQPGGTGLMVLSEVALGEICNFSGHSILFTVGFFQDPIQAVFSAPLNLIQLSTTLVKMELLFLSANL